LSSAVAAFIYSGIVSSGPWLFAVFSLGVIASIGRTVSNADLINTFMGIVIYAFALTTVITYGIQMAVTRYLADCLYKKEDTRIPSLLLTAMILMGSATLVLTYPFIWRLTLKEIHKLLSLSLFALISCMWGAMIFVSTLKAYVQVSMAFLVGFGLAIPASLIAGYWYGLTGFLVGLNIGICFVVFILCSLVLTEFQGYPQLDKKLLSAFYKFPVLFLYGSFTGLGIWCDKFILWFHHKIPIGAGLVGFPYYDSAMFIGYMTALPALAYFILIAETDLYQIVRKYTYLVNNHGNYKGLEMARRQLLSCLKEVFHNIAVTQGVFVLFLIITVPHWINFIGLSQIQISILRISILGAFFHMGMMLLTITLTYINGESDCFWTALIFLLVNSAVTWYTRDNYWLYGYGYFTAAFVSFFLALFFVAHRIKHLHFFLINKPP
jgi:uncharacterized membrane protein